MVAEDEELARIERFGAAENAAMGLGLDLLREAS
jgi:hypothetical protein